MRRIATREELDALPDRSAVLDSDGDVWVKESRPGDQGDVWVFGVNRWTSALLLGSAPLTVIHDPRSGLDVEPQRVHPSREAIRDVLATVWDDHEAAHLIAGPREHCATFAHAVVELLAGQPAVAEVRAQTLREAAAVARLDRVGGLSWIARAVEAWLNARAGHIAAADREAEGGAR